jgi:hypothetical protein
VPQVAHEGLIAEKAQFTIKQLATKIKSLLNEEPTWSWYVGCLRRILWMASIKGIPARTETDPTWHPKASTVLGDLPPVEILLVQGRWPEDTDQSWKSSKLKVALQVVKKSMASRGTGKRKRSRPLTVPSVEGYECGSYVLKHNAIGGVTNPSYLLRWRVRTGCIKPIFTFPPNPSNCTSKCCLVGATLEGTKVDDRPQTQYRERADGLLSIVRRCGGANSISQLGKTETVDSRTGECTGFPGGQDSQNDG